MSDTVIRAEKISKRYKIGSNLTGYNTLRESLAGVLKAPFNKKTLLKADTFWALKDVSFEVNRGEVLGLIGRNGAGKSTLLKILSRITKPTAGLVRIRGRVGSLLEVGTGFHPELSGRENIYLNGAILGMKRSDIDRKFDEIVSFAEIEKFLDTPVKFYSSGMYMRLAFSVAAHLEPEILLVDEVLAVGDVSFQKKCLGKMGDVAKEGRTVFFVSHNIGAILQLCSRAILLADGDCVMDGTASTVVSTYLGEQHTTDNVAYFDYNRDIPTQILSMAIVSLDGNIISRQPHTQPFLVRIKYHVKKWVAGSYLCLDVFNEKDIRLLWSSNVTSVDETLVEREPGTYLADVTIPGMVLSPGHYHFTGAVVSPSRDNPIDAKENAISIEITDGGSFLSNFGIKPNAATMIQLIWKNERIDREN